MYTDMKTALGSPPRASWHLGKLDRERLPSATSHDFYLDLVADILRVERVVNIILLPNFLTVYLGDDVAADRKDIIADLNLVVRAANAGFIRGRAGKSLGDHVPFTQWEFQHFDQLRAESTQRNSPNPQIGFSDPAVLHNVGDDSLGRIHRHREPDAHGPA